MPFNKPLSRSRLIILVALTFGILLMLIYSSQESHQDTKIISELPYQIGDVVAVIENEQIGTVVGHSLADEVVEGDKRVFLFEVQFEDGTSTLHRAIELRHAD